jgi:hypothetical protein
VYKLKKWKRPKKDQGKASRSGAVR